MAQPQEPTATGEAQKTVREISQHDIEQRAYGLWQADGGRRLETDYWYQARKQLERERDSGSAQPWMT
jgi:hypothetical protein